MYMRNITVMITHATSHLGVAAANHFLRLGSRVILVDDDAHKLDTAVQSARLISDNIFPLHLNFDSLTQLETKLKSQLPNMEQGKPIFCLMNLWPSLHYPTLMDQKNIEDSFQHINHIMAQTHLLTHIVSQHMYQQGTEGVVINVNDRDDEDKDCFNDTPMVIQGLTRKWSHELKPYNIRVTGLVPPNQQEADAMSESLSNDDEMVRNIEYLLRNKYTSGRMHEIQN
ncbi:MAG: SDR family NAD(P)-dependent oxidoreductase [Vibrio sp.]